jgi:serine/threonine-protein kinase
MDDLAVTEIPGTDGAIHPFFSPDGESVGFLTVGQVKKVRLDGSTPMTLSNARTPVRATWTRDGRIYFTEDQSLSLAYVPAAGGERSEIDFFDATHWFGPVLPDGKSVLLTHEARGANLDYANIVLLSLETLETKVVVEFGYDARYVPSGHLLFARAGNVLAIPFDLERSEVTGEAVTVASGVAMDSLFAVAQFSVSDNGSLVYVPGRNASMGKLAWVDRSGASEFLPVDEQLYNVVDLSPDNERIAVHVGAVADYIWIYDLVRNEGRKLLPPNAGVPRWNLSGDALAFQVREGEEWKIFEQSLEGAAPPRELTSGPQPLLPVSWTADARWVALTMCCFGIGFVDVEDGTFFEWSNSAGWWGPSFSPDGRWVAHASDETGQFEIWVRSFPDAEEGRQISVGGGIEPLWNHETGELYFRKRNQWMVTSVSLEPDLSWEPPKLAFEATGYIDTKGRSYDVTSDGERLLFVKRAQEPERRKVHVIVNFFDELERFAPTGENR